MITRIDEMRLLSTSKFTKQKEYWLNKLLGVITTTEILTDIKNSRKSEEISPKVEKAEIAVPDDTRRRLLKISKNSDLSIYIFLLTVLKILIYRYTNLEDIIVVSPLYKQNLPEEILNRYLFIRDSVSREVSFKDLLIPIRQSVLEAYERQDYPVERVLEYLFDNGAGNRHKEPLSDILCSLSTIHDDTFPGESKAGFVFSFHREKDCIKGNILYDSNRYDRYFGRQLSRHFVEILKNTVDKIDIKISDIAILSERERKRLLYDFNHNPADFPETATIYQFIERHSTRIPDSTAILFEDDHVSYRELNENANRLARRLRKCGIQTDQPVGILLDRSVGMVVSILAVWKAGGAYIPIDLDYPVRRINELLKDSGAHVLIAQPGNIPIELESLFHGNIIKLHRPADSSIEIGEDLDLEIDMNSLAYVIYTSGSTGKPKGAMVEHIGMMNHIQAKIDDLQITGGSVLAQNASHTFDISVWQFFTALIEGGTTAVYPNEVVFDPVWFIARLVRNQITVLEVVPSYLSVMLDVLDEDFRPFARLRYLLVTGETVKPHLPARWFEKYPGIKVLNAYGPTEASDDITHYIMEKAPDRERIPLGKPLQNLNIYIVDENMNLVPDGVKGEICVSGVGVGRGYLNDGEKTRQVFMQDPFRREERLRFYKCGDLGCWLPDGTIEFFGRKDYQVKIRGFRIELGEIENHLTHYVGVKEAVVIDREDEPGNKYLCAYVITDANIEARELKTYLTTRLPGYMVPSFFIKLPEMPLTPNGKINRSALPGPGPNLKPSLPYITEKMLKEVKIKQVFGEKQENTDADSNIKTYKLSGEERVEILYRFNNSERTYPGDKTIQEVFEEQAARTPQKTVLLREERGMALTYGELNTRCNQLAGGLAGKGIETGCIVGIMAESSFELIIAILAVLKTGAAYLPVEPQYPAERIKYILLDSQTKIVLSQENMKHKLAEAQFKGEIIDLETPQPYSGETTNLKNRSRSTPSDAFLIIYTSGTTGRPKGTLITNTNLVNYITWFSEKINLNEDDKTLLMSSMAYDLCYTLVYSAILKGCPLHILSEEIFAFPGNLLRYMNENEITYLKLTPSFLSSLVNHPDFSGKMWRWLRVLILGGESIIVKDVETLQRTCRHLRIMNHYGPTETTIGSAAQFIDLDELEDYKKWPGIGKPIYNTQIYILDRRFSPVPVGISGELCIAGNGVAVGYLNRPELTETKFKKNPFKENGRMYLTGDIARWLPDGSILFLGRADHQVKINGFRIELGEIERKLLDLAGITEALLLTKKGEAQKTQLWAYIVSEREMTESEIKEYLSGELPHYMLPLYFVQLEKMPLTPNGKINRRLLEAVDISSSDDGYEAPGDEVENKLVEIWRELLGIEKNKISITGNFFELGGHSLRAIVMISKIHKKLNVKLPLAEVFETPTIKGLAEFIKRAARNAHTSIEPVEEKEYYQLSSAQKRMYILQQKELKNIAYNIPVIFQLEGALDRDRLENTFAALIRRHESLRTSFQLHNGEPVQRIHREAGIEIEYFNASRVDVSIDSIIKRFIRFFDLSKAQLLRVGFIHRSSGDKYIFMVDMHHIISDGISGDVLARDFAALYSGEKLPGIKLQYKDYTEWQNRDDRHETLRGQREYWRTQFEGEIPVLSFPTDHDRPETHTFEGGTVRRVLGKTDSEALNKLALQEGATMYMVLLSIFYILLFKITRQEDIIVGTPVAGRRHADLEQVIGMFVNALALRNYPEGEKTAAQFLREVKKRTIKAFENQDYPFDDLVETVVLYRNMRQNPLFDVMFDFMISAGDGETLGETIGDLKIKPYMFESSTSKVDFNLITYEEDGRISIFLEYSTPLYKKETMETLLEHYEKIAGIVAADKDIKIRNIELITEEKSKEIRSKIREGIEEIETAKNMDFDI